MSVNISLDIFALSKLVNPKFELEKTQAVTKTPVFTVGGGWDSKAVGLGDVRKISDKYVMIYAGSSGTTPSGTYQAWKVGLAISDDGYVFRRVLDEPIIDIPSGYYMIQPQTLLYHDGMWWLFCHASLDKSRDDPTGFDILLYKSKDLLNWQFHAKLFNGEDLGLSGPITNPAVAKYYDKFYMSASLYNVDHYEVVLLESDSIDSGWKYVEKIAAPDMTPFSIAAAMDSRLVIIGDMLIVFFGYHSSNANGPADNIAVAYKRIKDQQWNYSGPIISLSDINVGSFEGRIAVIPDELKIYIDTASPRAILLLDQSRPLHRKFNANFLIKTGTTRTNKGDALYQSESLVLITPASADYDVRVYNDEVGAMPPRLIRFVGRFNGIESYRNMGFGLVDSPLGTSNNKVGLDIVGTSIYLKTKANGTETSQEVTGIDLTKIHDIAILWLTDAVYLFVDGKLVAKSTTNIPNVKLYPLIYNITDQSNAPSSEGAVVVHQFEIG